MRHSRLRSFALALLAGMSAGTAPQAVADDTEIYLGTDELFASEGQVRPNVLFMLDTSGSMSSVVPGTGLDRLDNMKVAFNTIMDTTNNINVGLMRFTDPGGPIMFPLANIDAPVSSVEGSEPGPGIGSDVYVSVTPASDDDAVELIPNLDPSAASLDTTSPTLNFGTAPSVATAPLLVTVRTGDSANAGFNTAEQTISTGAVNTNSSTVFDMIRTQINGIRFPTVGVPQGARILSARITGHAPNSDSTFPITIRFRGERNGAPAQYAATANNVSLRPATTAVYDWENPENFSSGTTEPGSSTVDLAAIVQELVCMGVSILDPAPGCPAPPYADGADGQPWTLGNPLALIVSTSSDSNTTERRWRTQAGAGGTVSRQIRLDITYNQDTLAGHNAVGLRFRDVAVPQGATITSARIEMVASEDSGADVVPPRFAIRSHLFDDAPTFDAAGTRVVGRPDSENDGGGAVVNWEGADLPEWIKDTTYQTPDLSALVQEIVAQPGWCGNNALSFEIEAVPNGDGNMPDEYARVAYSSNAVPAAGTAPGTLAPRLIIDYDEDSIPAGGGCINQIITAQVFASDDDAEQTNSTGSMSITSTVLDFDDAFTVGVRFRDLGIPQGANILEASLTLVSNVTSDLAATAMTITGEKQPNALPFRSTAHDITNRPKTSASVAWSTPVFDAIGATAVSPNLAPVIQEIVDQAGWKKGNELGLFTTTVGGLRRAISYNNEPSQAPRLRVKVGYDGTELEPYEKTVRDRIKEVVDGFTHAGFTPLVGQLFEAASYYRGDAVVHGRKRSHRASEQPVTRISHPKSWTGGTIFREAGCTDANLSSAACLTERIDGAPEYISPIDVGCQANYLVLLTDGEANHNANDDGTDHLVSLAQSLVGGTCMATKPGGGAVPTGERCGRDLAQFLATQDQRADLSGDQTVKTYTIGFNLCDGDLVAGVCCVYGAGTDGDGDGTLDTCPAAQIIPATGAATYMTDLAALGGGNYFEAQNADELASVFRTIIADILAKPTSFATPSLSVNAFNKLFNRNEVYFSLFEPSTKIGWIGNVKKYNVCDLIEFTDCTLGEILDANATAAIGADFRIKDSARSEWSDSADGIAIEAGGAAVKVPTSSTRKVYTYTGVTLPADVNLDSADHTVSTVISDAVLTKTMLGNPGMSDLERLRLLDWMLGKDNADEDGDGDLTEDRFKFEDPLHGSPVAVSYGGSEASPVDKLFVATNGGSLRMLNATSGIEEWSFIPQELLPLQRLLRTNAEGEHLYGLDLTPTIWLNDTNNDGKIAGNEGDFVRVLQAMRRGGNNIYSLEATPATALTDPTATGNVLPRLRWEILGGVSAGFEFLSQTWSQPRVTSLRVTEAGVNVAKAVAIFGAGYDPNLDKEFNTSTVGNGVFIIDAATGELITSIGGPGTGARLEVPGMTYAVPSDIAILDSNGDGAADRLYFGDLGGQVWRVDLEDGLSAASTGGDVGTVGRLADISLSQGATDGSLHATHTRKFHAAPDIVQVFDEDFGQNGFARYDLILIGTGAREDPLSTVVQDAFWAFRDRAVDSLKDEDNDGLVDNDDPTFHTITRADMTDLTGNPLQLKLDGSPEDPDAFEAAEADITSDENGFGWYIDLKQPDGQYIGEKVLSKPVVLAGKLFFTTYTPVVDNELINACQLAEGAGRLYGLNVLTGAALFADWNADGGVDPNTADRALQLGGGIPSDAVPIFQKEGVTIIVGGGGGATSVDPGIALPRERTYWYEQGQ